MIPLLSLALLGSAEAAARVRIEADETVRVAINRHVWPERGTRFEILLDPGRNRIDVGGRTVVIDVADGYEARLSYTGGVLHVRDTVRVSGLEDEDFEDWWYDPANDPATRPDFVPVDDTREVFVLVDGVLTRVADPGAVDTPGRARVNLRAMGGEWYDVTIGGSPPVQLRNFFDAQAELALPAGTHEVRVATPAGVLITETTVTLRPGVVADAMVSRSGLRVSERAAPPP